MNLPIIVDADTGFGNAVNAWHCVRVLERAGADAIQIEDQIMPNAHPLGANPFSRPDYIRKFMTLTDGIISSEESRRFLAAAQQLPELRVDDLYQLNIALPEKGLAKSRPGIF